MKKLFFSFISSSIMMLSTSSFAQAGDSDSLKQPCPDQGQNSKTKSPEKNQIDVNPIRNMILDIVKKEVKKEVRGMNGKVDGIRTKEERNASDIVGLNNLLTTIKNGLDKNSKTGNDGLSESKRANKRLDEIDSSIRKVDPESKSFTESYKKIMDQLKDVPTKTLVGLGLLVAVILAWVCVAISIRTGKDKLIKDIAMEVNKAQNKGTSTDSNKAHAMNT